MATAVTLPWPPSVNRYWRSVNGRNILSEQGRNYRLLAGVELIGCEQKTGPCSVVIVAYPPDNRRRDVDNILKAPLDALTHSGAIEDDSCVRFLSIRKADPDPERPRLEVTIEP